MLSLLKKPFNKKKEDIKPPPLSLMGKLPCEADFIRHAITHSNATLLDQWLQSGFQQLIKWDKSAYPNAFSNIYFYQRFDNPAQIALGSIYASYDKSGRHYPLLMSKWDTVEQSLNDFMPFVPMLYCETWQQFSSFNVNVMQERTLLTQFTRNFEPHHLRTAKTSPYQSMMRSVEISIQQFLAGWDNAERVIAQGIHELKHYETHTRHALCLPLPKECEGELAIPYIAFWLQLCEHFLPGQPWKQVFWQSNSQQSLLWIHFYPLHAELLPWLLIPVLRQDEKRVICVTGGQQLALLPTVKQWLSRDRDSVCQLLHTIMRQF